MDSRTSRPSILQPVNTELLERCAYYVREWHGISHEQLLRGEVQQPPEVAETFIQMHNTLHDRDAVSDELLAAVGFRAIMRANQPTEIAVPTEEVVSLVPRITRPATRWVSPQLAAQYERNARFTARAK